MGDARRISQAMEEIYDIIRAPYHPRYNLVNILKRICGNLIGSFITKDHRSIISFCKKAGRNIEIDEIIDSFDEFSIKITIDCLVSGGVRPCIAHKSLLLLHTGFCYNMATMLSVRSEKLLKDANKFKKTMRSRRSYNQLLNLDLRADDEVAFEDDAPAALPPFICIEELGPSEPMEMITDQDPGIYLLNLLIESGAETRHLLKEDEPLRPIEIEEEPMFGMPAEYMWDTDAVINWLPEHLRPSSLFEQEQVVQVQPEQGNNARGLPPPPPLPAAAEPEPAPRPPPRRPRRVQAADDALHRVSRTNHLDQFLKLVYKKGIRERNLEHKNHLKMLQDNFKDTDKEPTDITDEPAEKRPCPFTIEEIQDLLGQLPILNPPELPMDDQHTLRVADVTMASNLSAGIDNVPLTPDVQGAAERLDNVTPLVLQNLPPHINTDPTFIEHMVTGADGELPPFIPLEHLADDSLRIEPMQVGETPQPAPHTIQPEIGTAVDEPMQIQGPEDNVERMMQNLFQEPENAALTVSVLVGETSFVHTLPTNEVIEPVAVPPEDNIAGRLRPARRRRRLEFDGSPPSPPARRRRRRRRQPRDASPADVGADGHVADAIAAPHQLPDANLDDLGVMPLPEIEPHAQLQQEPAGGFDRTFLETPGELRKNNLIEKLKELQNEHGNLINFLQICPFESTLRAEAAVVFVTLIELCHAKQIELIQEVAMDPDKLFIKTKF